MDRRRGRATQAHRGNAMSTCPGNDPGCPCQDGDACHYRDMPGSPGLSTTPDGWCVFPPHVFPLSDYRPHVAIDCWCQPTDQDGILVHHAMDEREQYEEGRKLS